MIEIKNVSKKYGSDLALSDVSCVIDKGLNFIVGPSGSGKTSLLRILSGMDSDFEGDVLYLGKSIKALTDDEKGYFYNNVFGFVWQDFNLLENLSVLENIMLPLYLKDNSDEKRAHRVLKELKITDLKDQKVSTLSGGQKQRVAIARELLKNPQVIIADEPTSALDAESAKVIMDILRDLSNKRTVIIVSHDLSLIDDKSIVYELDKGVLVKSESIKGSKSVFKMGTLDTLKTDCALSIAKINPKRKFITTILLVATLIISGTLLLVPYSGSVNSNVHETFDTLYDTYGKGILDISVAGSFMSASGGDEDGPNVDVEQDIGGLYDKYLVDPRVESILFTQAINDIRVVFNNQEYSVESTGNVPVFNDLVEGKTPMGSGYEVAVSEGFLKKHNLSIEDIMGKEVVVNGAIYNWDSGQPVLVSISIEVVVVGVVDSNMFFEYEGEVSSFSVDDSFFFSRSALDDIRKQAGIENSKANFSIRAKAPEDLIAIKDELNAQGIVPLGQFELIEDLVRLNNQTTTQSKGALVVITILAIAITFAIGTLYAFMRRREFAIYKVSGYSKKHLLMVIAIETILIGLAASISFLVLSPIINALTKSLWSLNILSIKLLVPATLIILVLSGVLLIVSYISMISTNTMGALKDGSR